MKLTCLVFLGEGVEGKFGADGGDSHSGTELVSPSHFELGREGFMSREVEGVNSEGLSEDGGSNDVERKFAFDYSVQ